MRLLFGCLMTGFFSMLFGTAEAQNKFSVVQGHVYLQKDVLADAAKVILVSLQDTSANKTLMIRNGSFTFNQVLPGSYMIAITSQGYQKYITIPFEVTNPGLLLLPAITLEPAITALKEVTITNRKLFIEALPDKTILNIEKGIIASGTSILDVLATAPGIRVTNNDEIRFKGGQEPLIAINGKSVRLSAEDAALMLRNMPSGDVETVELIANPPARYDAAGNGGVINIILKEGKSNGFNGSVTTGVGYGNFGKYNEGINFNYRSSRVNIFGNLSGGESKTDHIIDVDRKIGNTADFFVHYYNQQRTSNPSFRLGTDYFIDSSHTVGFLISGNYIHNNLSKYNTSDISNHNVFDSVLTTTSTLSRHINNTNYNLNYSGNVGDKSQTLSADLDYSVYRRNSMEDINSQLFSVVNLALRDTQSIHNAAPTKIYILSARGDYVKNYKNDSKLEAGIKNSYVKSNNKQLFDELMGGVYTPDPFFSNDFVYEENIISGYATYTAHAGKKFDYNVGLRAEYTASDGNTISSNYDVEQDYLSLFPQGQLTYNANENNAFMLNYSRRIDRPSTEDVNPIVIYQDKYNFKLGNPYIRPAYQQKVEIMHNYKNKFITSIYATRVTDFFDFTYFKQNDTTKVYTITKQNLKSACTYGVTFNIPVELTNWWSLNADVDLSYQRYQDYSGNLNKGTTDAIVKVNQQIILPQDFAITLSGQYEVPTDFSIIHYNASRYLGGGISKLLFNNAATLTLTVEDIFNSRRDSYSSNYTNLNLTGYDKRETRIARLGFIYRFGKNNVTAARKHVTGNSDEQKRIIIN